MEGISLLQDFAVVLLVAGFSGWIFRRMGLAAVVGYLVAGILVGPFTPPFTLVSDVGRIETLTELGLAFLMFFVGLGLSLKRIRRMGAGVVVATVTTAFLVFLLTKSFAMALGFDEMMAFLLAAMLMTSSSAIIVKMLAESGLTHERFAQNAQGVTVLEDVVAIVLLTIIGSRLHVVGGESRDVGNTLFLLVGFVALAIVAGLILLPKLLARFSRPADADLCAVLVCGLVFVAGLASIRAGFSVALGAFLLGVVTAETRFKSSIEKSLAGAQDMFSAIFFVAIGMLIDVRAFVDNIGMIALISAFAIIARSLAATVGFVVSGHALPLAVSSAIIVTPIGEFAYVIARLGVDAGAAPSSFYAVAVGVSIVTAVLAPIFARQADRVGGLVERFQPGWVVARIDGYRNLLDAAGAGFSQNHVWRLTRRRTQIALLQIVLLGGVFGFANPVLAGMLDFTSRVGFPEEWVALAYWVFVLILALALIVAIWQSVQTLCMVYAEAIALRTARTMRATARIRVALQAGAAALLTIGVYLGFPLDVQSPAVFTAVLVGLLIFSALLWRRFAKLSIRLEASFGATPEPSRPRSRMAAVTAGHGVAEWHMEISECEIPDRAQSVGQSVRELALRPRFGCSIIEIDRQGHIIDRVRPDERIFPGDRLLLVGTDTQLGAAIARLTDEAAETEDEAADFDEAVLDVIPTPSGSHVIGRRLADMRFFDDTGVLIIGIERNNRRIQNPSGDETVQEGDILLVIGSISEIREFKAWLMR